MTEPRQDKSEAGVHDPALSALYRRSGDIQPPVELDDAVLDAARRASRRRRWIFPLSTAAILVIGVGLVLRTAMQPEFGTHPAGIPGTLTDSPSGAEAEQTPSPAQARRPRADDAAAPAAKPQAAPPRELTPGLLHEERAEPPRTRSKASAAPQVAPEADMGMSVEKAPPRAAPDDLPQAQPEPWLTRIRELLLEGRRAEAKQQLAAFRRQYPGYPIPEDLRELR